VGKQLLACARNYLRK